MNKLFLAGAVIVVLVIVTIGIMKQKDFLSNGGVISLALPATSSTQTLPEKTPEVLFVAGAKLDVSGQGLTKTPMQIFERTELVELNLSNNKLDGALPAEIRLLKNLKVLNVSHNSFTGVPAEIGQLENLEVLDLSYNNLTGLPQELGNLSHLQQLNVEGNNYTPEDLATIQRALPSSTVVVTGE